MAHKMYAVVHEAKKSKKRGKKTFLLKMTSSWKTAYKLASKFGGDFRRLYPDNHQDKNEVVVKKLFESVVSNARKAS